MNTKPSFSYGIKGKLISAVSMLLVAVIMVVSSTYAWFTLSTAPEVTGISTAIGANGALEIKLNTTEDKDPGTSNHSWGNLVNFENAQGQNLYGLDKILLLPARLNATGNTVAMAAPLKYPTYTPDGRPALSSMQSALLGLYDSESGNFNATTNVADYGVVAVGSASGMTDRQMAFRQARTAANTAMTMAANKVARSMQEQGGTLAGIVVAHLMDANAKITVEQLASLQELITSLDGPEGVLYEISTAYQQQIIAIAASQQVGGSNETLYLTVKNAISHDVIMKVPTTGLITIGEMSHTLDGALLTGILEYQKIVNTVATARAKINTLVGEDEEATWEETSDVLNNLIKYTDGAIVKVCGVQIVGGEANKQEVVSAVTKNLSNITVELGEGSGVYESIADQCKDLEVTIHMTVNYNGMNLDDVPAKMITDSSVINVDPYKGYLQQAAILVEALGAPGDSNAAAKPLTEHYGYLLNFLFQTNAAKSNLLLQTAAIDRIYGANNTYAETQGSGSNMIFAANAGSNFDADQIKALMGAVRIVFLDGEGTILAKARLDANAAVAEGTAWKANLYLVKEDASLTGGYEFLGKDDVKNAIITPLNQNDPKAVSVLVYIDGDEVENKDVAYDAMSSVTGKLNLQFSSDAELVPMEYGEFIQSGNTTKYKVTFNGNGGTGEMAQVTDAAASYKLPENAFTPPENKTFAGWATSADGTPMTAGETMTLTGDTTLYAIWTETT